MQEETEGKQSLSADQERQIAFVRELGSNVVGEIVKDIEAGKIPDTWDGHELRWWLADRFAAAVMTERKGWRHRQYRNVFLTRL